VTSWSEIEGGATGGVTREQVQVNPHLELHTLNSESQTFDTNPTPRS